jgi:hypothetical protein
LFRATFDLVVTFNQITEQEKKDALLTASKSEEEKNTISEAYLNAGVTEVDSHYIWFEKYKKYLWLLTTIQITLDIIIPVSFAVYVLQISQGYMNESAKNRELIPLSVCFSLDREPLRSNKSLTDLNIVPQK